MGYDISSHHLSTTGEAVLWITFGVMLISTIAFATVMFQASQDNRTLPMLTMLVTTISSLAYFAMAASEGRMGGDLSYRETFYARYIDWGLSTPILLSEICIIAGLPLSSTLFILICDELMIMSELFATLDRNPKFRWAWYAFSIIFWLPVVKELIVDGRRSAHMRSENVGRLYETLIVWTLFLWTLYPVVWALAIGADAISIDGEIISYSLLDIATKVIFGFCLIFNKDIFHLSDMGRIRLSDEPEEGRGR